jgi:hypothetical protein
MPGRNSLPFSGAIKMLLVSMNSLNAVTPGSDSGGGVSGENFTNIEVKEKHDLFILKDLGNSYRFTNAGNPVLSMNITGNVSAGGINIAVESLKNTWPANNNLASMDIRMVQWNGKTCVQLETLEQGSDSNFICCETSTDRFSLFAITGIKGTQEEPRTARAFVTTAISATTAKNPGETQPSTIVLTPKTEGFEVAAALIALSAIYLLRRR